MFKVQINRILSKAAKANVTLGKVLPIEKVQEIENNIGVKLPISYVAYLTEIQNVGHPTEPSKRTTEASIKALKLPKEIEALEAEIASIHQKLADTEFYKQAKTEIKNCQDLLVEKESELEMIYDEWEGLSDLENARS